MVSLQEAITCQPDSNTNNYPKHDPISDLEIVPDLYLPTS